MKGERGFDAYRKKITGKEVYLMNCQSCMFMDDDCINPNVTSFDIVETDTKRYCSFWKGYTNKKRGNKNER